MCYNYFRVRMSGAEGVETGEGRLFVCDAVHRRSNSSYSLRTEYTVYVPNIKTSICGAKWF
jgi:hypothetical protein